MFTYRAGLLRVVDGDTCDLDIDLGLYTHKHERIRLAHIDTPERGQPGWHEAKIELDRLLRLGPLLLQTVKDRDKYGRFVATVIVTLEDLATFDVGGRLVEGGFAVWREY